MENTLFGNKKVIKKKFVYKLKNWHSKCNLEGKNLLKGFKYKKESKF